MDICVWDKCNNRCLMCTNPEGTWPTFCGSYDYSYDAIIGRLRKQKDEIRKFDSIYLSGGEPTIHPRFLDLLEFLKKNFPAQTVKLLTNGRRFLYRDFTRKVMGINPKFEIDMSLHGPNARVHDSITRTPDSFNEAVGGLVNLLSYKQDGRVVGIRYVITGLSYKYLEEFLGFMSKRFPRIDRIIFIFWEIEEHAEKNFDAIKIDYAEARQYAERIHPLLGNFKDVRFYHFPLCTLPETLWPHVWRTLPADEVGFPPACSGCSYKKYCLGVPNTYLDNVGGHGFVPPKGVAGIIPDKNNFEFRPIAGVGK